MDGLPKGAVAVNPRFATGPTHPLAPQGTWEVYRLREDEVWEWWATCRTEKIAYVTANKLHEEFDK